MSEPTQSTPSSPSVGPLAEKASSSAMWSVVGYGGQHVVRLVSNLILTRLLLADDFGLMALVNVFVMGLHLFSDMGFGPAIVQNKREDPDFVNTIWTILVIRGVVLCSVALLLSGPYAAFYGQPDLVPLIRVASVSLVIDGFISTSIFTHERHLNLKRPIVLKVGVQLVSAIAMVIWAWFTRSVWSLVVGSIVHAIVLVALSHLWLPGHRSRFRLEPKAARYLFSFGSWIFLGTLAMFAANQLDRIILGRITDMATLGVYSIAIMLATAPAEALTGLTNAVLVPLYTRVHYSTTDLGKVFRTARWPVMVLGGWAAAGFIGGGETMVRLLYDSRYHDAGWMLQILSAGVWFGAVLGTTYGSVVLAIGRSDWIAARSFSKVVGMAILVPLGFTFWGFPGAVIGLSASELFRYAATVLVAGRMGFNGGLDDLKFSLWIALSALAGWSAVAWLDQQGQTNVVLHTLVVFVVVTAFWVRPLRSLLGRVLRRESLFISEVELATEIL